MSSVPPLPPELTAHIVDLSLPPLSFDTFRDRADILLRFSLVCQLWRELAQQRLFGCPVLASETAAKLLLDAVRLRPQLVTMITALRIRGADPGKHESSFVKGADDLLAMIGTRLEGLYLADMTVDIEILLLVPGKSH